jgi:hypothetical protein
MLKFTSLAVAVSLACWLLIPPAMGQNRSQNSNLPISTWQAPAYWDASSAHREPMSQAQPDFSPANPAAASGTPLSTSMAFVAIVPCRLVDTRGLSGETGAFGPPAMNANETRTIPVLSNTRCNIPSTAQAYSLNFTVVTTSFLGFLSAWPTGNPPNPTVSILNDFLGTVVANAAVVPAGTNGSIDVFVTASTQVVIDMNGYYVPQISLAAGSAAAPSLTFAGDSTSGLFSSGAGTVNVATGGASRLTVAANGNVGIGTTTPASTLDVAGDINMSGGLRFLGTLVLQMPGGFTGNNIALGNLALRNNTTGTTNTASGFGALQNNTTGSVNTASGNNALAGNTIGVLNTATGAFALFSNTSGTGNTAMGADALQDNTTGGANTAAGEVALQSNTTGSSNTATGFGALKANTTGTSNTALGTSALFTNTTGNLNIAIGLQAGLNVSGANSNNIHVGSAGASADSGAIRIGTPGTQTSFFAAGIRGVTTSNNDAIPVVIDSTGQLGTVSSSRRFKEDIQDMGDATGGLMRLRPVTFRYIKPFADGSKPVQYGLIAEEVAEVYPDLIARSADGQIETVKYQVLDAMLLNEVQRQQAEIRGLEQRLATLEAALASISAAPRVP